jgi:RHS repeat-associated protein
VDNSVTTTYTYDNAGQMTAVDSTSYTYDGDGNTTTAGSDTYTWDAENRLAGSTMGGVTTTYGYNGAGLRTSQTTDGVTVSYAWDLTGSLGNILQDSEGNKYVYGLDLISRTNGTTQEYYLTDGLGSTTEITDGSGTVTGTYAYDAFGAVRAQTGATTEWSFTGEQHDATGLEYVRARYYDASTGRFLSQDPMPLLQRYAYANDNPANFVDPSGMSPESDRFHQLMAAEEQAQAWAKKVLSEPCWLIHAFCKHVVGAWKKAAPYVKACLIWGAQGGLASALLGGSAFAGAAIGCAAGVLSVGLDKLDPQLPILANPVVQCGVWGAAGFLIAAGGKNASGAGTALAYEGGCVAGGLSWLEARFTIGRRVGVGDDLGACGAWAGPGFAFGGPSLGGRAIFGGLGCAAGALDAQLR